jgi:hypothetical protein
MHLAGCFSFPSGSRLQSAVQVLPVCTPPFCSTLLVCHRNREHTTDPLRPLPACADAGCSTGHVGDPCSHIPLSGDARYAAHAGPPHTTRRNPARCDGAVPPARHAGAHSAMLRAGSSSVDQVRLEDGQAETPVANGQGQRRTDHLGGREWQRGPGREADRLCQSRVVPAGYVPGATDGSMPVGFVACLL